MYQHMRKVFAYGQFRNLIYGAPYPILIGNLLQKILIIEFDNVDSWGDFIDIVRFDYQFIVSRDDFVEGDGNTACEQQ